MKSIFKELYLWHKTDFILRPQPFSLQVHYLKIMDLKIIQVMYTIEIALMYNLSYN